METLQDLEYKEDIVSYDLEALRAIHFNTTGQYKPDIEILKDFLMGFKKYHKVLKELKLKAEDSRIPFNERVVYRKIYDLLED